MAYENIKTVASASSEAENFSIKALSYVSVLLCCIITTAGSAIVSTLFGVFVLKEKFSVRLAASLLLMPFSKKQMANIASRTLFSNISSVITVILLANMNISVYSVISNSIGIISGAVLSKVVFKEYMSFENKIAVLFAVAAIIVSP